MRPTERILIAVDGSDASRKAVSYVARLLSGAAAHVRLFHVVEPVPPSWASVHGDLTTVSRAPAGDPEIELVEEAKRQSRPIFEAMREILERAGLEREHVECSWYTASREDTMASEILELARDQGCPTVVVGRAALPWYRELFHRHLGESLVKQGEGLSVWVVG